MVYQGKQVILHLEVCANYSYYWFVDTTCFPADLLPVVPCCNLKRRSEPTSQEVEVMQKQRSPVWLPVLLVPDVGNDQHFYLSDLLKGLKWPRFALYCKCMSFAVGALSRGSWLPLWLAYWTYLSLSSHVRFLRRSKEMWRTLGGFCFCAVLVFCRANGLWRSRVRPRPEIMCENKFD